MAKRELSISPGVVIEHVGDDVVAVVPGKAEVVKFTGETAKALIAIRDGRPVIHSDGIREELLNAGLVSSPKALSRRALVRTGLVGAGAGVAVLAMPSVAVAVSSGDGGGSGPIISSWFSRTSNDVNVLTFFVTYASNLPSGGSITELNASHLTIDGGVLTGRTLDSVTSSGDGAAIFRYTGGAAPAAGTVFTGTFTPPGLGAQNYEFRDGDD